MFCFKDVQDPSVIVSFPLEEDESISLVAWTTTPWTLPSNLALCVNPELQYVKVKGKYKPWCDIHSVHKHHTLFLTFSILSGLPQAAVFSLGYGLCFTGIGTKVYGLCSVVEYVLPLEILGLDPWYL